MSFSRASINGIIMQMDNLPTVSGWKHIFPATFRKYRRGETTDRTVKVVYEGGGVVWTLDEMKEFEFGDKVLLDGQWYEIKFKEVCENWKIIYISKLPNGGEWLGVYVYATVFLLFFAMIAFRFMIKGTQ